MTERRLRERLEVLEASAPVDDRWTRIACALDDAELSEARALLLRVVQGNATAAERDRLAVICREAEARLPT